MGYTITSRVNYDSLQKITLVNSKGKSYNVAFNLATKYSNWVVQLSCFHKSMEDGTKLIQNWFYNPHYKSVKRTLVMWHQCIKDWKLQNAILKQLVF
jgi:hypothetical protein